MARARNIKPGLFKNEILGVADPLLTILFESLWCLADREGRLEDRPLRIKAETFPYRDGINCAALLDELQGMGFIVRYTAGQQALIEIVNFKKHQTPHNTERASELPARITEVSPLNNGGLTQALPPDSLIPDSLITDTAPEKVATASPQSAPVVQLPKPKAKTRKSRIPEDFDISDRVERWAQEDGHSHLARHFENFVSTARAKGYEYVDWDEAFMRAVRDNWAKVEIRKNRGVCL